MSQSSVYCPSPPAKPTLLHFCTTIARYTPPLSRPPPLYAIHHTMLVNGSTGHTHTDREQHPRHTHTHNIGDGNIVFRQTSNCCSGATDAYWAPVSQALAFTRYSFTSSLLCTNQPSFHSPRLPALPTLVQYSCTIIWQCTTPLPTSRVYAIHHRILVIPISCKGQVRQASLLTVALDPMSLNVSHRNTNNLPHPTTGFTRFNI